MTACNETQSASFGKKAVSAALAGTLAVGMVPGVALAATADNANDGIETMTATVADEFANATISQVSLNGASAVATPETIEIPVGTENLDVLPAQLTSALTGNTLSILDKNGALVDGLKLVYSGGSIQDTQATCPTEPGTYTVQVAGTGQNLKDGSENPYGTMESAKLSFTIVGKSLAGATLYEVNAKNPNDVSDTTFTYNGGALSFGVALNGVKLITGVEDDGDTDEDESAVNEYTVTYYDGTGNTKLDPQTITDAGDYVAVVTGVNDYANSEVQIKFTVNKLDLSTADIVVKDVELGAENTIGGIKTTNGTTLVSVNGVSTAANVAAINAMLTPTYEPIPTKVGAFTVGLAPIAGDPDAAKNITGTATVPYNVVDSTNIAVEYNGVALATSYDVSPSGKAGTISSFDASKIKVYPVITAEDKNESNGPALTTGQYTVTVKDKDGNVVPTSSLATPGVWTVTVAVDSKAMNYTLGGQKSTTVTVTKGDLAANDIFVTYDGQAVSSLNKTYTGQNYLSDMAVKVVVNGETLVEGTDYEVTYTNTVTNEKVTEFTNAGHYAVTVTSNAWNMSGITNSGNVCAVTISPVNVTGVTVADTVTINGKTGIAYTGSDINPTYEYASVDADGKPVTKNKKPVMVALPASAYKVDSITGPDGKSAKSIKAAGTYEVTLVDADENDNYTIPAGTKVTVEVIDAKVFADVAPDAWYAQVVDEAHLAGYMNGYAGTDLFGPNDKITRAQVACVLFNMAGGKVTGSEDNGFNENYGYTSFDDVNPKAYYAQAVAWAKDAGVVNGFAGTDNFGPDQLVTREQFACMLWNYAKATLSDTVKDIDVTAALASKPDGDKVSDWAKDGVAWAVQNKIMGNGGVISPLANVTRAETAAMAINFQPYVGVTGISVNPATVTLSLAGTTSAKPVVTVTEIGGAATTWTASSDDTDVATVAADGTITGLKAGTATITYVSTVNPKVTATCEVTVTA